MEKKRVLISTFNNSKNNYGGVFQAFALSETVKKLGHDVRFVTIVNPIGNNPIKPSLKNRIKNFVASILSISTRAKRDLRERKFLDFKEKTQNRVCYDTYEELLKNPPMADVYLSGSDQVWNPRNLRKDFFFPYVSADKTIISYAASMGYEQIPEKNRAFFERNVARYDAVSVREDTVVEIVAPLTNKKVHHHIDPVFLVSRSTWESMAVPYQALKYKRYILLYLINWDKKNNDKLLQLKKETGLPLVLVTLSGRKPSFADQVVMDASPEEFLHLMKCAEMVVASSFHGVALSIILNKPFIAVSGQHCPTRIQSLLRYLDLQDHDTLEMSFKKAQFDPDPVMEMIKAAQEKSLAYLKESIALQKESEK